MFDTRTSQDLLERVVRFPEKETRRVVQVTETVPVVVKDGVQKVTGSKPVRQSPAKLGEKCQKESLSKVVRGVPENKKSRKILRKTKRFEP